MVIVVWYPNSVQCYLLVYLDDDRFWCTHLASRIYTFQFLHLLSNWLVSINYTQHISTAQQICFTISLCLFLSIFYVESGTIRFGSKNQYFHSEITTLKIYFMAFKLIVSLKIASFITFFERLKCVFLFILLRQIISSFTHTHTHMHIKEKINKSINWFIKKPIKFYKWNHLRR